MSDSAFYSLLALLLFVAWFFGLLPLGQKAEYKRLWLKREVWVLFGFCPRCNSMVNFDRNKRAICPHCGRAC